MKTTISIKKIEELSYNIADLASKYTGEKEFIHITLHCSTKGAKSGIEQSWEYRINVPIRIPEWALPAVRRYVGEDSIALSYSAPQQEFILYYTEDLYRLLTVIKEYYNQLLIVRLEMENTIIQPKKQQQ